jgi:hypothetical protein
MERNMCCLMMFCVIGWKLRVDVEVVVVVGGDEKGTQSSGKYDL